MKSWNRVLHSALFRLLVIVMAVVIPLNLLTLILSNRVIAEAERQISMETENALNLYMNQVDSALTRIHTKLYMLAREDADFIRLNTKEVTDQAEYYRQLQSVVSLGITMSDILEDNSLIGGAFACFPQKDYYIGQGGTSQQSRNIRSLVMAELPALEQEKHRTWQYSDGNGSPYLIFLSYYRNACYGAWVSLDDLAATLGFAQGGVQAFVSKSGQVFYSNTAGLERLDTAAQHQWFDGTDYTVVSAASQSADFSFVQLLSKGEITESLPAAIRVLQILSIVAIAIVPIILVAMYYWIGRPVGKLTTAMERIEQGDVDYRIEKIREGTEFDRINQNFNRVMDEVSRLKIHMYEQQLKAEKVRLGFLSQQIQPHFILNALNILYSYEPEEYALSQKMILCLSKYFRYVVNAPADYVELGAEMEHIRNYFEIQQARFLRNFRATVVCDEELADCLIPPLLIQNFTENAIKHSLIPGQVTSIVAEARKTEENRAHICVYDTGAGIPDEVLERIAEFRRTHEFRMDLGVGIQNSIDRLSILYGDEASLDISRIEPQGTRIDIILPIKRKEVGADERDFG